MTRTFALFLALCSIAGKLNAQTPPDPLGELAGTTTRQWSVIGATSATGAACAAGEAQYTFQFKPAQVEVKQCTGGAWKSRTEAVTSWAANGKSGIAFGGTSYEVKSLPPNAPVCKGNANCVRLASVPDGKTDATTTIYLTH
ncbi:MAG: hypothetical protein IPI07_01595 [Flavobacteriales bacterium]|nr:hypothetical protein [Flavobacteriales bacterium]